MKNSDKGEFDLDRAVEIAVDVPIRYLGDIPVLDCVDQLDRLGSQPHLVLRASKAGVVAQCGRVGIEYRLPHLSAGRLENLVVWVDAEGHDTAEVVDLCARMNDAELLVRRTDAGFACTLHAVTVNTPAEA